MRPRALVFDLDGLIVDTESAVYAAWQELYATHGAALPLELYLECVGSSEERFDPCAYLGRCLGRALDPDPIRADHSARFRERANTLPMLPGVAEYLDAAAALGLRLGVASSSDRAWVEAHLTRLGIADFFESVRCREDAPRVKPDPALYRAVLEQLGVAGAEAIALEDSLHGVMAAKRSGMFCVAVPNPVTRGLAFDAADLRLSSLADLPLARLLERLAARARTPGSDS